MKSRADGYEQEGDVFSPLRSGLASRVIDPSGHARIGVWGVNVLAPGEAVYSVRQNLWLLLNNGQPTAEAPVVAVGRDLFARRVRGSQRTEPGRFR